MARGSAYVPPFLLNGTYQPVLAAGSGVSVTVSGNTITIAATSGAGLPFITPSAGTLTLVEDSTSTYDYLQVNKMGAAAQLGSLAVYGGFWVDYAQAGPGTGTVLLAGFSGVTEILYDGAASGQPYLAIDPNVAYNNVQVGPPLQVGGYVWAKKATSVGDSLVFLYAFTSEIPVMGTDANGRLQLDGNGTFGGVTTKNNTVDDGSGNAITVGNFTMPSPGTATSGTTQVNSEIITLGASVWNTSGAGSAKAQSGTIELLAGTSGNPETYATMRFATTDSSASGGTAYQFLVGSTSVLSITGSQNLQMVGVLSKYKNVSTVGTGIPAIFGAGLGVSLGTTSTAVCSYSGATGMYLVKWVLSCKTNSTPTLTLTYSDPQAGAQSVTLYNSAMVAGQVASGVYPIYAATGTAIALAGSDSVASGDIYASAIIAEVQ